MAPGVQELDSPHLDIPITIDHLTPVHHAGLIPAAHGDVLYLSNLDNMIGSRVLTPTVYFYRSKGSCSVHKHFTTVVKDALSSVLVSYYPLSGRIRGAKIGKLEVLFGPEQGALLVETHTEIVLSDLGDVTVPNPAWTTLIYKLPDEGPSKVIDMPLVITQGTYFSCGGFNLGLRICHCICDGFGAMQFLSVWATSVWATNVTR